MFKLQRFPSARGGGGGLGTRVGKQGERGKDNRVKVRKVKGVEKEAEGEERNRVQVRMAYIREDRFNL